jgi:hypothetical protein
MTPFDASTVKSEPYVYRARRGESGLALGDRVPRALKAAVIFTFGFSGSGRGVPVSSTGYMPSLKRGPDNKTRPITRTTMAPIAIDRNRCCSSPRESQGRNVSLAVDEGRAGMSPEEGLL